MSSQSPSQEQETRLKFNEANAKVFNVDQVTMFEHEAWQYVSRLAALKFLNHQPGSDHTIYNSDNLSNLQSTVQHIDHNVWPEDAKVLDFACGVGYVSLELLPNVGSIVGVDISPDMVNAYRKNCSSHHKSNTEAHVVDLMEDGSAVGTDFDVAVCSMSFHHIPNTALVTQTIASHLKPSGWLFVMDFDGLGLHERDYVDGRLDELGIAYANMDPENIAKSFAEAGLRNVSVSRDFQIELWFDHPVQIARYFTKEQKLSAPTRVVDGKTQFQRVVKLAVVAGQRV